MLKDSSSPPYGDFGKNQTSSFAFSFQKNESSSDTEAGILPAAPGKVLRGQRKRTTCWCKVLLTVISVLVLVGGFLAIAEVISKPGYDKSAQDTRSMETRRRIQTSRKGMATLAPRLKTDNATLTKQELVDYVQLATAYASASYTIAHAPQNCVSPVSAILTEPLSSKIARAYVARDDEAQLLVVAIKGISGFLDFYHGLDTKFVSINVATVNATAREAKVQNGVQKLFKSLEDDMLRALHAELSKNPSYTILVTGHNLGGSVAVLAGLALRSQFPDHLVLVVTQGQARTFNEAAVQYIDEQFPPAGFTLIRATHSTDGIVNIGAPFVNRDARHHSGEVWHFKDSATPDNVLICHGRTDSLCSRSYTRASFQVWPPALPWSAESLHYFDIEMNSAKSVQCGGPGGLGPYALLTSRRAIDKFPDAGVMARSTRQ